MFERLPIEPEKIQKRLIDLSNNIEQLREFQKMTPEEFEKSEHGLAATSSYLLHSLEDIFGIGLHLLARLPNVQLDGEYGEILPLLAKKGVISEAYVERNRAMSKYRNRLVHFYLDIKAKEMHQILQEHLKDLEQFSRYIKAVLEKPEKFGLAK